MSRNRANQGARSRTRKGGSRQAGRTGTGQSARGPKASNRSRTTAGRLRSVELRSQARKQARKKVGETESVKDQDKKKRPAKKSTTAKKSSKSRKDKDGAARPATTVKSRSGNKEQLEAIRLELLKKKESLSRYLQTELSGLESADKHHLADLEEMASDTYDTDSLCEIMEVGADTLEQIEQALQKIEAGTYGLCEDCGGQIPFERLEALPFATLCVACKRKREMIRR